MVEPIYYEPTSYGDMEAAALRRYYEAHRETWWQRFWRNSETADNLMLGMRQALAEFHREHPTAPAPGTPTPTQEAKP